MNKKALLVSTEASLSRAWVSLSTAVAISVSMIPWSRCCWAITRACCSRSRSATLSRSRRVSSRTQSTPSDVVWWWPQVRPRSTRARGTASPRSCRRRASCRSWREPVPTFWEVSPALVSCRASTSSSNSTLAWRSTPRAVNFPPPGSFNQLSNVSPCVLLLLLNNIYSRWWHEHSWPQKLKKKTTNL